MSKSIWEADPKGWPKAARDYVFLAAAFNDVGRALFGDEWTGREALSFPTPHADEKRKVEALTRAVNLPPPPLTVGKRSAPVAQQAGPIELPKVSAEAIAQYAARRAELIAEEEAAKQAALSRRVGAAEWIAERARDGELHTVGLWVHGQAMPVPLAQWVWNVQNDWALFVECQARVPGVSPVSYWLFFTRESLNRCLLDYRSQPAQRRPRANSYEIADAALVGRMRELIEAGEVSGAYQASRQLAHEAAGHGTEDARAKRLERRYLEKYGD